MAKMTIDVPVNYIDKLIADPKYQLSLDEMAQIMDYVCITVCNNAAEAQGEDKKDAVALMMLTMQIRDYIVSMKNKNLNKNQMIEHLEIVKNYLQ